MSISSSPLIAGLLATVALGAIPAIAQEVPAPAQPPAPPAAPATPVAAPTPAAPQDPAAPTVAAPADPAAAAPVAQAEVKPPEPPPVLPTSGDGAVITTLLTQVCRPFVEGKGTFDALAKSAGLTQDRRTKAYVKALSQRPFQIEMAEPGTNNRNVCEMRVRYAPGWDAPIVDAMNIWRFLHDPQLRIKRNDIGAYKDAQRTTTTWDNWENQGYDGKMIGLILVQLNKPDGTAINTTYDEALVQYSQRKALSSDQAQGISAAPPAPAPPAS